MSILVLLKKRYNIPVVTSNQFYCADMVKKKKLLVQYFMLIF